MTEINLETLKAEAAAIAAGHRPPMRQPIPVRIVENLHLAPVTPEAIRRRLKGAGTRVGDIVGIEWYLIEHDPSAALYEAACPYEFCEGRGTIMASTDVDRHGVAVLPFTDPGALCCIACDSEIERRYEEEAERLANSRRAPVASTQ